MATDRPTAARRGIGTLFDVGTMAGLDDSGLLDRFLSGNRESGELAFAALVERHGPMVLRVCRTVLADAEEARDAFQATFLILVTRVGSLRRRESLASWLHGVALRVSRSARSSRDRRREHEGRVADGVRRSIAAHSPCPDLDAPLIHEEFGQLPDRYRAPMLLCDLEGLTHDQAARRLSLPVGTIKSRLARGRARLRERLTRRGLAPASALLGQAAHILPSTLVDATARMAASGLAGTVPASVRYFMQGARKMTIKDVSIRAATGTVALGVLAASLALASDGEVAGVKHAIQAEPTRPVGRISFVTRILTMTAPGWDESPGLGLKPVRIAPPFRAWTAPASAVSDLIKRAGNEVHAPRVTAEENQAVIVKEINPIKYIADGEWKFDESRESAGFVPVVKDLEDGQNLSVSARSAPGGLLVRSEVKDRQVRGFEYIRRSVLIQKGTTSITACVMVPETSELRGQGEWIVAAGDVLIISLGYRHDRMVWKENRGIMFLIDRINALWTWEYDRDFWESPPRERLIVIDPRSITDGGTTARTDLEADPR